MSKRLIAFVTVSLLPLSVQAAEMPKSGTDSFTNTWVVTSSGVMKVGDRTLGTYEISGIHRNDNRGAMITNMGMRLLGLYGGTLPNPAPERFIPGRLAASRQNRIRTEIRPSRTTGFRATS